MCTVLQQHLNRLANGYGTLNSSDTYDGPRGRSITPGANIYHHHRAPSPVRYTPTPIYSYLQDPLTLKVNIMEALKIDLKDVTNPILGINFIAQL